MKYTDFRFDGSHHGAASRVIDSGRVRVTHDSFRILVEELPRKPCKKYLRTWHVHLGYQVISLRLDGFLAINLINAAKVQDSDDFGLATARLGTAILEAEAEARTKNPNLHNQEKVHVGLDEVYYAQVVPADAAPIEVKGKDFVFTATWTDFQIYSPNSDLQQIEPHYSYKHPTSPAAARKLYQLLKKKPDVLKELTWSELGDFFARNKISYDTAHSQWS